MRRKLFSNIKDISKSKDQILNSLKKIIIEKLKNIDILDLISTFANLNKLIIVLKISKKFSNLISRFNKNFKELKKDSK